MKTQKNQKYYLGLDMGTSSVGWAVTDSDYRLIRKKGKDIWGIREFDEAVAAAERSSTYWIAKELLCRCCVGCG